MEERLNVRPRLRFSRGRPGLPLRSLPPSLFSSKCPPPFAQFHVQVFFTQVLAFALPVCWVRHSHHASTSPSSTFIFAYSRVLRSFLLSSLRVPRFPWRWCPNFATAGTVAAGNDFALLGCITPSRSIARTPSTAVVPCPRSDALLVGLGKS